MMTYDAKERASAAQLLCDPFIAAHAKYTRPIAHVVSTRKDLKNNRVSFRDIPGESRFSHYNTGATIRAPSRLTLCSGFEDMVPRTKSERAERKIEKGFASTAEVGKSVLNKWNLWAEDYKQGYVDLQIIIYFTQYFGFNY